MLNFLICKHVFYWYLFYATLLCIYVIILNISDIAKHHGDTGVHDAVLSVSNDFTDTQQQSLK